MNKTLLALLAHPDDESFGPGGTLAKYAHQGVDVHVIIATDGAAGTASEGYEDKQAELAAHRMGELKRATNILGVTLHCLDYRDSGMNGDPVNNHPKAFINADKAEATGKVVSLIRQLKPDIFLTHDETGGYFHPDHIQCWKIGSAAFSAAADPSQYVELGMPPHQTKRMYFTAFPNRFVKFYVWIMRLRRQDPTKVGRNKDIDLTKLGMPAEKIHARIDFKDVWDIKRAASAEHGSQGGGGLISYIPQFLQKAFFGKEMFMRGYPPVPDGYQEDDLFAGIEDTQ